MDSLPEEFFVELNELLRAQALDELEKEAEYWEMKAELHNGI
jgi:hypothetical protein